MLRGTTNQAASVGQPIDMRSENAVLSGARLNCAHESRSAPSMRVKLGLGRTPVECIISQLKRFKLRSWARQNGALEKCIMIGFVESFGCQMSQCMILLNGLVHIRSSWCGFIDESTTGWIVAKDHLSW